ncbi:hypothetical protein TNCT_603541 [Trichonephila clavata]|uniref:Uncharacterized protein n=1 Tax=Trichonephila clavata TaxID=2740835 RepID=A0A8X6GWV0_TRICU|nr:hypothetical protein TNCT_603541 [Trichonephila clavata]
MLSPQQKEMRVNMSRYLIGRADEADIFLKKILTGDETCAFLTTVRQNTLAVRSYHSKLTATPTTTVANTIPQKRNPVHQSAICNSPFLRMHQPLPEAVTDQSNLVTESCNKKPFPPNNGLVVGFSPED